MTRPQDLVNLRGPFIIGPGGKQILAEQPAGNVVEPIEPASGSRPGR